MVAFPLGSSGYDDPRQLRALLGKARSLAVEHALHSVVVGLAGFEGDDLFPEMIDFVESALRVDDAVFRMTRERVVVLLADADESQAAGIITRILAGFRERFPTPTEPAISLGYFEVGPDVQDGSTRLALTSCTSGPTSK